LSTWCYCFLGYVAILISDPTTRDQLAHARLVITEALRHGGAGWMDYDRAFCQQASADPSLQRNTLLLALQAAGTHYAWLRTWSRGHVLYLVSRNGSHSGSVRTPLFTSPYHGPTTFVSHGTGACASFQAIVDIGTSVPPVASHTKRGIAKEPPIAPVTSSNVDPLNSPAHMLHLTLSPMPTREAHQV
jgi:hypothetical protein